MQAIIETREHPLETLKIGTLVKACGIVGVITSISLRTACVIALSSDKQTKSGQALTVSIDNLSLFKDIITLYN